MVGWNHPGFGDSTVSIIIIPALISSSSSVNYLVKGLPFPSQEFNAVDVVVRYVVTELGFAFEDIILYAWSIGELILHGVTSTCIAGEWLLHASI